MPKILVIEDEPDQNKLIKLRLEARGFDVLSAGKAREGIAASVKEKPDLILMDMILPDMHGLDATIKLKQNPATRPIPVIALSAVGSPDFIKACLKEGIVAFVRKPYDPRELYKTIERIVRPGEDTGETLPPIREPSTKAPSSSPERLRRSGKGVRKRPSIDELLQGALADFNLPLDKITPPPSALAEGKLQAKTVLIIDDDTSFGRVASTHLASRGYRVSLALDGINGLKEAFQSKPHLILLNLILPGGGGEIVLANLKGSPESSRVPVFVMSSLLSSKDLEEKARKLGAQGFISKPIEPEDLLYIIESLIGA